MRLVLLIAALAFAALAAALGFGHAPEYAADFGGWLALSLATYVGSHLVVER